MIVVNSSCISIREDSNYVTIAVVVYLIIVIVVVVYLLERTTRV